MARRFVPSKGLHDQAGDVRVVKQAVHGRGAWTGGQQGHRHGGVTRPRRHGTEALSCRGRHRPRRGRARPIRIVLIAVAAPEDGEASRLVIARHQQQGIGVAVGELEGS